MNTRKIGGEQEERAAEYLAKSGYRILERNYRCRAGEIDLIGYHKGYLVFVEVKFRASRSKGEPEEAVGIRKQRQLSKIAAWYLAEKGLDYYTPCRFDVAAVTPEEIRVYEDAFPYRRQG